MRKKKEEPKKVQGAEEKSFVVNYRMTPGPQGMMVEILFVKGRKEYETTGSEAMVVLEKAKGWILDRKI